jgi:hypothetical protein
MNKQIAKTLNQPAFDRLKDWYDIGPVQKATLELFAVLIVQECVDWIDGSPSTDAGQLVLTKSFIIANIKEHFGVE